MTAFLRAFGSHLPERRVGNREIAALVGATPEWILEVSGIEERRYAAEADTVASLGKLAAQNCLANAGATPADLGMILVASGSAPRFCPGPASQIAASLGLAATPALDIPVASCGSLIGLAFAAELAPRFGPVLVIGTEIMSRCIELTPGGKDTAILFGDGAGAALVDPASGFARIADSILSTDGASAEILKIENGRVAMEGRSVILQAVRKIPRAISELLARNHLSAAEPCAYLMHQANLNLIARVAQSLKVPQEEFADRFFVNLTHYGNTSSASLLIAADEWRSAHPEPLAGPLVLTAFGAGLNWGAMLALPA
ncbi:MAG TPA: ketoacyl-ACP synthase III [Terracidiphilus sp.]|nr:ketoacyl-ACP synthase III [Terracidiphilus sp.]